jgi:hypothetical protein
MQLTNSYLIQDGQLMVEVQTGRSLAYLNINHLPTALQLFIVDGNNILLKYLKDPKLFLNRVIDVLPNALSF